MESIAPSLLGLKRELLRQVPEEAPLIAWRIVCGERIAARTEAVAFSQGKLTVLVEDKAWQAELGGLWNHYIAALGEILPGQVKSLEFVVTSRPLQQP